MSPKRHAGPRTVDSFHIPANAASDGQHVVDRVDRRRGHRRTTSISAATLVSTRDVPPGRNSPTDAASATNAAAGRRAAASPRASPRRARPPGRAGVQRTRRAASTRPTARSAAGRRDDHRPPSTVDEHRVLTATGGHDPQRAGDRLGALGGATHPEQRIGGPRRHRAGEVDLRQRRDDRRQRPAPIEHPHVLDEARRRVPRVVARREHPPVAAGHDRDAVRSGDGVQPHDDRGRAEFAAAERRQRRRAGRSVAASPSCGRRSDDAGERLGRGRPVRRQARILDQPQPWALASTTPPLATADSTPGNTGPPVRRARSGRSRRRRLGGRRRRSGRARRAFAATAGPGGRRRRGAR